MTPMTEPLDPENSAETDDWNGSLPVVGMTPEELSAAVSRAILEIPGHITALRNEVAQASERVETSTAELVASALEQERARQAEAEARRDAERRHDRFQLKLLGAFVVVVVLVAAALGSYVYVSAQEQHARDKYQGCVQTNIARKATREVVVDLFSVVMAAETTHRDRDVAATLEAAALAKLAKGQPIVDCGPAPG